jgi:hypothetical protein
LIIPFLKRVEASKYHFCVARPLPRFANTRSLGFTSRHQSWSASSWLGS